MRRSLHLCGLGLLAALAGVTCARAPGPEFNPAVPIDLPEPDAVDAVVFLIGDAGEADLRTSPVLVRLASDVEFWSENLVRDSAVTVLFLGDNVYPVGIRDRDHASFAEDSVRLWSQIDLLAGPFARRRGSAGIFVAGNHDWGNMPGARGVARLSNQAAMLDSARAGGISVRLMPQPGEPGPVLRDVRENVRMLLMDTHWFLQEPEDQNRIDFFARLYEALVEAEDRHVILASHHPYQSAGPHGMLAPGAQALGLLYLMEKSGTLVQDLNSPIYSDFLTRMHATFVAADHRPLIFAAGHDHSLQVFDPRTPEGPQTVLVSGAGSKLTDLTVSPLLRYAASRPGYMTLIFRSNEAVDLYVVTSDESDPTCPSEPEAERLSCMEAGVLAMSVVYSERLAQPESLPDTTGVELPDTTGGEPADTGRVTRSPVPGR